MKVMYALNENVKNNLIKEGHEYLGEEEVLYQGKMIKAFKFRCTRRPNKNNYSLGKDIIMSDIMLF